MTIHKTGYILFLYYIHSVCLYSFKSPVNAQNSQSNYNKYDSLDLKRHTCAGILHDSTIRAVGLRQGQTSRDYNVLLFIEPLKRHIGELPDGGTRTRAFFINGNKLREESGVS